MNLDILSSFPCLTAPKNPPCDLPSGGTKPIQCCEQPAFRDSNPTVCNNDPTQCSDPLFAAANPLLCPNSPRLILKPSYLLKSALQQVQYQAFLLSAGTETLVAADGFTSGNLAVAQVGANGKCTTVGAGITSISATFGSLSAYGQIEVIADCPTHETDFVVLIDNSKSMNTVFGGVFPSKLNFAKETAKTFMDTIDFTKDRVSVWDFSGSAAGLQVLTNNKTLAKQAVQAIQTTQGTTNLAGALQDVVDYFASQALAGHTLCIVLFTDGENKTGGNPLPISAAFEAQDNVIIVVGCRAWDGGFTLLDQIASGGFFINALPSNVATVPMLLANLKGYFCSGNCDVTGGKTIPFAKLNYDGFINWDVTAGHVDLIGDGGAPLYDILPGNGLYVDMCGSSAAWLGELTIKAAKAPNMVMTTAYRFSIWAAGNQRQNVAGHQIHISITVNSNSQLDQTITIDDWLQPFTQYTFDFLSTDAGPAIIKITQTVNPGEQSFGTPIDVVELINTDTATTVFRDDFDGENVTTFPPPCGGGNCYAYGCADDAPVPAQVPDPNPTTDTEDCKLVPGVGSPPFGQGGFFWNNP